MSAGGPKAGGGKPDQTLAAVLAEFVLALKWEDLPLDVRHEAKRALLNWLGCAVGGSQHDNISVAEKALLPVGGDPHATIIGRHRRTDMLTATLLNCTSSGVHSFDDTHAEIILHPTGPIAASLMALSENRRVSGRDFLTSLVLGIEIESRLSRAIAVPPAKCHVGWYLTGLTGGVSAAAAAARTLGLSANAVIWAMGIASGQGAGNRAMHAAMTSAMVPAHAGQCGLRAALMAQAGFTCGDNSLENPNGFLSLFAETANPGALTDKLGQHYEIMANTYKPWPCGIVIHPVVDACLAIRRH
jgi:2-methylcitrate dehydratase PrpD